MRASFVCGSRLLVVAAIAASLLYGPAALIVVVFFSVLGVSPEAVLTVGGWVGVASGMLAWWLLLFGLALPCAILLLPWNVKLDGFRREK
jgi:hypothetical protein